jgi:hypothetical protein
MSCIGQELGDHSRTIECIEPLRPSMLRFQMSLGGEGANELEVMR